LILHAWMANFQKVNVILCPFYLYIVRFWSGLYLYHILLLSFFVIPFFFPLLLFPFIHPLCRLSSIILYFTSPCEASALLEQSPKIRRRPFNGQAITSNHRPLPRECLVDAQYQKSIFASSLLCLFVPFAVDHW